MPKRRSKKTKKASFFPKLLTSKISRVILEKTRMLKNLGRVYIWFLVAPITLSLTIFSLYTTNLSKTKQTPTTASATKKPHSINLNSQVLGNHVVDFRPIRVAKFLKNTPLEPLSEEIVAVSDKYGIDYRLIPAIAMKETGAGRTAPDQSFNAWGFQNGKTRFASWEQAIDSVAKTLKERYIAKGLTSPDDIMPVYAPPAVENGGGWAISINKYIAQMENSENNL